MPTKINSPVQSLNFLKPLAANIIKTGGQRAIQGVAKTAAKTGLKGIIGAGIKANPIGAAITGAQALFGGVKEVIGDRREAKDAGEKYKFFEGVKDFGAGALKGATGVDLTDQDVYEEEEAPTYETNINQDGQEILSQEIPLQMSGKPLKVLTGIKKIIPKNMSMAEYNSAIKFNGIAMKLDSEDFEMLDGKQGKSSADFAEYKKQQYKEN